MWSALLLVGPPLALLLGEPIDELLVLGVVGVVALPVLLGHSMARVDASVIFDWPFILAYLGGNAVTFAGAYFLSRFAFKNDMAQSSLFAMVSVFANTGYMGIPLAIVAFGPDAALPAAIATVFQTLVFIAVTEVLIVAGKSKGTGRRLAHVFVDSVWGLLKSPLFIGCALGMGWSLSGLKLPVPVDTYAKVLGAAAGFFLATGAGVVR